MFAGRLFTWGIRFGVAVILARMLHADGYGLYSLALTVATLAATFPPLGLDSALLRYTAIASGRREHDRLHANLRFVLIVSLALSLVAAGAIFLLARPIAEIILNEPKLAPLLVISSLMVPSMVLNQQLGAALQGLRRIEYAVLAEQFTQPLIRLILVIGLVVIVGVTSANALLAWVAASVAATASLAWLLRRALPPADEFAKVRPDAKELLLFSIPVFLSSIVITVGGNLQTLFLATLSTISAVGVFAIASQLNLIGAIFHSSIVSASLALFAEAEDRGDRQGLQRLYQTVSKWSVSLNLPIFLIVVAYPEALLLMFGPEFGEGVATLRVLAFGNLVNAATGTSGAVLDMTGHTRVKLVNASVGVGLAVALNFLLIPGLGVLGAALAVVAATTAVNLLRIVEVQLLLKAGPYNRTFYKPISAAAVALMVMIGVKLLFANGPSVPAAVVGIGAVLATYVVVLVRLGLSAEDRLVLDRIGKRLLRRKKRGEQSP